MNNTVLKIPEGADVTEISSAYYWYGNDNIVYFLGKKADPIDTPQAQALLADWQRLANYNPFCLMADVTNVTPATKVIREYAAIVFPKEIVAIAILSASPMGRMVGHLFITLKPLPYPAKMFSKEQDAREWLTQYLQ